MNSTMKRFSLLLIAVATTSTLAGCQHLPGTGFWGRKPPKTSYRTAAMRMDAIRDIAHSADGTDSPEQREITNELARQIQIEPDPLVREAIVDTVSKFKTPLAQQVLEAGTQDGDAEVRRKCCVALGKRGDAASVAVLARVLHTDDDDSVRVAAVQALGGSRTAEAIKAVTVALEDRDPAMQYAGVKSLESITGKDFDGNVSRSLEFAKSGKMSAVEEPETSVASRIKEWSPF